MGSGCAARGRWSRPKLTPRGGWGRAWRWALWIGLPLIALAGVKTFSSFDWGQVAKALTAYHPGLLGLALALAVVQLFAQCARIGVLLTPAEWPGPISVFRSMSIAQLLNAVAPLRPGDPYLVAALSRSGGPLTLAKAITIVLNDRIADITALCVLGVVSHQEHLRELAARDLRVTGGVVVAGALGLVLAGLGLRALRRRFPGVDRFVEGLFGLLKSPRFLVALAIAFLAWGLTVGCLEVLLHAGGIQLGFADTLTCVCLLNLGLAVPVTVANVGVFEGALALALGQHGVELAPAVAAATAFHLIGLVALALAGLASAALTPWARRPPTAS